MSRRSSWPIVAVLVLSLLCAGATRWYCIKQRRDLDLSRGQVVSQGNLSQLNSFALGLFLGGLRGPLVMALWTSSENQKSDRELEDIDTKIELIRLLQPEFDTVHLFQIWNKAYNISVQMANVPNKYTTILDALEYARSVDAERPDNINIVTAIAGLYFDKLGGASEKYYFSPRLHQETLPDVQHVEVKFPQSLRGDVLKQARLAGASTVSLETRELPNEQKAAIVLRQPVADALKQRYSNSAVEYTPTGRPAIARVDSTGRRLAHETLLDNDGNLLPEYTQPRPNRPTGAQRGELGYLIPFQPFPIGVSPYALAYNYYAQARFLQTDFGQRHAQVSDRVISSRPALSLTKWSEEDWYAARRAEIEMAGKEVPSEDEALEAPTQDMPLDAKLPACPLMDQVLYRYDNAARTALAGKDEFELHLKTYPGDVATYSSHIEGAIARSHLLTADAAFLRAVMATGDQKREFADKARTEYRTAANLYSRHILRYYTDQDMLNQALQLMMMPPVDRQDVTDPKKLPDAIVPLVMARIEQMHVASQYQLANSEDFRLINVYIIRAQHRIQTINQALK